MPSKDYVILVNTKDEEIGKEEKLKAHLEGKLHRAFSIFIINNKGEMLLHQRASNKYHSPDLWTNACCSHPAPREKLEKAIPRRLQEELNIIAEGLKPLFSFTYKVTFGNGLTEHEYDHIWLGKYNKELKPNLLEVKDWGYFSIEEIRKGISQFPDRYTFWFKELFERVVKKLD